MLKHLVIRCRPFYDLREFPRVPKRRCRRNGVKVKRPRTNILLISRRRLFACSTTRVFPTIFVSSRLYSRGSSFKSWLDDWFRVKVEATWRVWISRENRVLRIGYFRACIFQWILAGLMVLGAEGKQLAETREKERRRDRYSYTYTLLLFTRDSPWFCIRTRFTSEIVDPVPSSFFGERLSFAAVSCASYLGRFSCLARHRKTARRFASQWNKRLKVGQHFLGYYSWSTQWEIRLFAVKRLFEPTSPFDLSSVRLSFNVHNDTEKASRDPRTKDNSRQRKRPTCTNCLVVVADCVFCSYRKTQEAERDLSSNRTRFV